jgi:hypothetical protein
LAPHLSAEDPRYAHRIEITAQGSVEVTLDATVRPGAPSVPPPSRGEGKSGLRATLTIETISGLPVAAGDALLFRLGLSGAGSGPVRGVRVRDLLGPAVYPHSGSACLKCHQRGDSCDVATEKIFSTLQNLDRRIRGAESLLEKAEIAGMEVSLPQFELKRQGISAAVESRALIHSFDYERILKRASEGNAAAQAAFNAGNNALEEMGVRRRGLAVSLVLIAVALLGLGLKIRQVDRERGEGDVTKGGYG